MVQSTDSQASPALPMASIKTTTNLSALFVAPKKALFATLGYSKLLCFDQVFAYIINISKDKEPIFSCAGVSLVIQVMIYINKFQVIAFDQLPENGEISEIQVNADSTKAVLVGKYYAYVFTIPDTRATARSLRINHGANDDLMDNKIITT